MNNTILAIDLGKYKSVACILDQNSGEFRFTTLDTTRAELLKLVAKVPPTVIVIEACLLADWVHDLCTELGVRCLVANTASEAWKFKHLKRKTDKDDALRLAQLHLLGQLPTVTLPTTAVRQWRSLIAVRQTLVGRRVAVQNRMRALFVAQGLEPRGDANRPQAGRNEWDTRGIFELRWLFAEVVRFGNRRVSSQLGLSARTSDCSQRLPVTNGRRAY
jgi:transposase